MSKYNYFPIIKTRDAELRCFSNLDKSLFEKILPIYELTKSRKTKVAPDGDIYRRMMQIKKIQGDNPFILDLCVDSKYINPQIEDLLSPHNGFSEWQCFIFEANHGLNIIPMIHIFEDEDGISDEVIKFVKEASVRVKHLAVRLPYDLPEEDIGNFLNPIFDNLNDDCAVFIILDAEYIREKAKSSVRDVIDDFVSSCQAIEELQYNNKVADVIMLCTSFPSNVASEGKDDSSGQFIVYEEIIYNGINKSEQHIKYGDYVSINTEQIEMKGGTFVPRIDIIYPDASMFFYKRYRRHAGGYVNCANEIKKDHRYNDHLYKCWANKEVELASNSSPTGISPAFWISVRMEYYIHIKLSLRSFE